ncbi:hypothetical protein CRYUN_Cryun01aG0123000 [Craigia yunnanensis]
MNSEHSLKPQHSSEIRPLSQGQAEHPQTQSEEEQEEEAKANGEQSMEGHSKTFTRNNPQQPRPTPSCSSTPHSPRSPWRRQNHSHPRPSSW